MLRQRYPHNLEAFRTITFLWSCGSTVSGGGVQAKRTAIRTNENHGGGHRYTTTSMSGTHIGIETTDTAAVTVDVREAIADVLEGEEIGSAEATAHMNHVMRVLMSGSTGGSVKMVLEFDGGKVRRRTLERRWAFPGSETMWRIDDVDGAMSMQVTGDAGHGRVENLSVDWKPDTTRSMSGVDGVRGTYDSLRTFLLVHFSIPNERATALTPGRESLVALHRGATVGERAGAGEPATPS